MQEHQLYDSIFCFWSFKPLPKTSNLVNDGVLGFEIDGQDFLMLDHKKE